MKNKRYPHGFTLIEMLVVVLIVGILAGIALPQYQLAVDKTKFAKLQSAAKNIADAYIRYNLVNNTYPANMSFLDIDLPGDYEETNPKQNINCRVYSDFYCCIIKPILQNSYGDIVCGNKDYSFIYYRRIFQDDGSFALQQQCRPKSDNKRAERLCEHLSTYCSSDQKALGPYEGSLSGYKTCWLKKS